MKKEYVFISDIAEESAVEDIIRQGAEPVFVDVEYDTLDIDPEALNKAKELYPEGSCITGKQEITQNKNTDKLRKIRNRYEDELSTLPIFMYMDSDSLILIDENALDGESHVHGKSSPVRILNALAKTGNVGTALKRPLHMRDIYSGYAYITADGNMKEIREKYKDSLFEPANASTDLFFRGIYLPENEDMTEEEQERVIETVFETFQ